MVEGNEPGLGPLRQFFSCGNGNWELASGGLAFQNMSRPIYVQDPSIARYFSQPGGGGRGGGAPVERGEGIGGKQLGFRGVRGAGGDHAGRGGIDPGGGWW